MPEIEFLGDWNPAQAQAAALALQKSLGVGDGGGAETTVQGLEDNPAIGGLSPRQKRLIELWRRAGDSAFQDAIATQETPLTKSVSTTVELIDHACGDDCRHDWEQAYGDLMPQLGQGALTKTVGKLRRDEQGRTYRLNANRRWERFTPGGGGGSGEADLAFSTQDGEFGPGVYFQLGSPQGWLQLRLKLAVRPAEMITADQFYELEDDLAASTALLLTKKGVKAIAQVDSATEQVTLLMVRSAGDIEIQGAIANSGKVPPTSRHTYRLVRLDPQEDGLVLDVEVAAEAAGDLTKAAITEPKRLFPVGSPLNGSPVAKVHGPTLSRSLVRAAVDRCKKDGLNLSGVKIQLVAVVPDFLPRHTPAFCLPCDRAINLVAHDPQSAINRQTRMLARRLKGAVRQDAIAPDEALTLLETASNLNPEWWLEGLIKRYAGAIRCAQVGCVMGGDGAEVQPWGRYLAVLQARGLQHWGSRRTIAECMAEDFRVAHDPAGLPNLVTLLWDVAVPEVARMAQNLLLAIIGSNEPAPLNKSADPIKRVMRWRKIPIGVSHDPGDKRHGRKMTAGYGHIRGSYGDAEDGMAIDVYIGPDLGCDRIFKVRQVVPDTGELDESKYVIGCWSEAEAQELYLRQMPQQFFGGVEPVLFSKLEQYQND